MTVKAPHRHRADRKRHAITGWTRCVAPIVYGLTGRESRCDGAAHGGVVIEDQCACGAIRRVESNGRRRSTGWIEPEEG